MKSTRIAILISLLVSLLMAPALVAQTGRGGGMGGMGGMGVMAQRGSTLSPDPYLGEGPTCDIDAVIYRVYLSADQIGRIDLAELEKAAGKAEDFEKALAKLGKATPAYRARQSVDLNGDSISISSQTPYVSGSSRSGMTGSMTNTVQYTSVGAIFQLAGKVLSENEIKLSMKIQVSLISDSKAAISENLNSPIFRNASMTHFGQVEAGKPFLMFCVDAAANDAGGEALAYIAKVKLGTPSK